MPRSSSSIAAKILLICGMLLLGVYVVFGQTARHGFVIFDDPDYVYQNPFVQNGLTLRGELWAFLRTYSFNWHPVTWISHMLDCQFFGLDAGWHHVTNFVLHGVSSCLLFVLLRRLTDAFWASAFVAAVFAIHPLHVESVAWIAERKDILAGLFFFLTLLAYESYVRNGQSPGRYALATLLFILGLMAKPMLVTLPLVALLLDYWPLGRFGREEGPVENESGKPQSIARMAVILSLVMEKLPWLVLSAGSCVITIMAQKKAIMSVDRLPFSLRLPNAAISYAVYLKQAFWPRDLAVYYPYSGSFPPMPALVGAIVVLAGISFVAWRLRRKSSYLLVGWLWYVGMLVPVIGLMQVGAQAMADRYTYLPQIGIYIMVAWAVRDIVLRWQQTRRPVAIMAAIVMAILLTAGWRQTTFWRDDIALWTHTAECTTENTLTLNNFALALWQANRRDEAIGQLKRAIAVKPDFPTAYFNLGMEYAMQGRAEDAIESTRKAIDLEPDWALPHNELAKLLGGQHRWREAIEHLERAQKLDPEAVVVQENLAWVLATTDPAQGGDPQRALALAERLSRILPSPGIFDLDTLAAAYASTGRYTEAVAVAQRALAVAKNSGTSDLVSKIQRRLDLYEAKKPYRNEARAP